MEDEKLSSLIPTIKVSDVPVEEHKPIKSVGVIGDVKLNEIANGYVQVDVPLEFINDAGKAEIFHARWNVRPEWFSAEYAENVKAGSVQGSELTQYNINMSGLTRGLFKAAKLEDMDFDLLKGQRVGFKTKARKNDPSRGDISFFYEVKES